MVSPLVTVTGATVATAVALRGTHRRTKSGGRGRGVSNRSDVAATATPRDSSEASTRRGRLTRTKATEGDGGDAADGDRRAFFAAATGLFSPHGAYQTRNTLKPARCTSRRPERASPGPSPSTFSGMPRHLVASTCSSRQKLFFRLTRSVAHSLTSTPHPSNPFPTALKIDADSETNLPRGPACLLDDDAPRSARGVNGKGGPNRILGNGVLALVLGAAGFGRVHHAPMNDYAHAAVTSSTVAASKGQGTEPSVTHIERHGGNAVYSKSLLPGVKSAKGKLRQHPDHIGPVPNPHFEDVVCAKWFVGTLNAIG